MIKKGDTVDTPKGMGEIKEILTTKDTAGETIPAYFGVRVDGFSELQYLEPKEVQLCK